MFARFAVEEGNAKPAVKIEEGFLLRRFLKIISF